MNRPGPVWVSVTSLPATSVATDSVPDPFPPSLLPIGSADKVTAVPPGDGDVVAAGSTGSMKVAVGLGDATDAKTVEADGSTNGAGAGCEARIARGAAEAPSSAANAR